MNGSRLGVPVLINEEALHGACWGDATVFPQAIALAATRSPDLVAACAAVIADELRAVVCRQALSPVLNLARDARGGRVEETYGEDPHLAARIGTAFCTAIESAGVVATPKHFALNSADGGRDSNAAFTSERLLRETEYVPFEAAVRDAGVRGMMAAYNSLDGVPCHATRTC